MAYSKFFNGRNLALFSFLSLGGSYFFMKSRTLAQNKERAVGDYSVSVDRSGGGV
ncbi:hypothetical protein K432DRAFT_379373 [Lepidopterella palustris CBS 459.81]|uniref:Uncharacterized protein n=1 Tax=Lepidopterella palustris CBS 459.81 TaxID=1314670 RepID=A0A8E2EGH8_9PEZI|nr:hypothetical protein K432DRAFT_379373 [Lepidopterella palustris CBS 459.81]